MDRKRLKFVLLGSGVVLSMAFLMVVGMNRPQGMVYYLTVSEFIHTPNRADDGFRVNGKVEEGSIVRLNAGQDVRFTMTDGAGSLPVSYHGIIPDTFVDRADVVVEGRMAGSTFQAHTLLAKCPSKYESADAPSTDSAVGESAGASPGRL